MNLGRGKRREVSGARAYSLIRQSLSLFLLFFVFGHSLTAQEVRSSTVSNDFWVAWIENVDSQYSNESTHQRAISLTAMGDTTCMVTVYNPSTGWSVTGQLDSGSVLSIPLPDYAAPGSDSVAPTAHAFHVTSTAGIILIASYIQEGSSGAMGVLPTDALRKHYVALDYPTDTGSNYYESGAALAFVAIVDSTVISMQLPCTVDGMSLQAGDSLHISLMAGQSYVLSNHSPNGTFSGMEVTSNRRFAMFQGNRYAEVPNINASGDMVVEQSVPVEMWGTEYVLVSTRGRNDGDQVRVVASEDCEVSLSSGETYTLSAGGSVEFTLPSYTNVRLTATHPVCVAMYMRSTPANGVNGDATMVVIPSITDGVRFAGFTAFPADDITDFYVTIVARSEHVAGVEMDGIGVPFQVLDSEFCYSRLLLNAGYHYLRGRTGDFVAWAYGCGGGNAYAYLAGRTIVPYEYDTVDVFDSVCRGEVYEGYGINLTQQETLDTGISIFRSKVDTNYYILHLNVLPTFEVAAFDSIQYGDTLRWGGQDITVPGFYSAVFTAQNGCDSVVQLGIVYRYDTVDVYDTVCQYQPYSGFGFEADSLQTSVAGEVVLRRDTVEDGLPHRYLLHLEVLPVMKTILRSTIMLGDTLLFNDRVITRQGTYVFYFTAANGCDSLVNLEVRYESVGINASANGVCPGTEVILTATGTHTFIWSSEPYDPEVEQQQGLNPIKVHPMVTTVYQLMDNAGTVVGSTEVGTAPPPGLKVVTNRDILDYDHPVLMFADYSSGRYSTQWHFADGYEATGEIVRRVYHHPLPDSAVVTMRSCNVHNCCADTTVAVPLAIKSIWFANVFTPSQETNNVFQCITSFDVQVFSLDIFDRWGVLVWHTDDVQAGWDGRSANGTPCPQGAYAYHYYMKAVDGTIRKGYGTVTLLR